MIINNVLKIAQNSRDVFCVGGQSELKILKKYPDFFQYVVKNHTSLDSYHTTAHLYGTALIAQQLCFEKLIDYYQTERICIAAFLHDYCHQNYLDDDLNIQKTIKVICAGYEEIKKTFPENTKSFDLFNFNEILRFIKYTTYTEYWESANIPESAFKILRDADQLYSLVFLCDDLYDVLFQKFSNTLTHVDFIKYQLKRVENIHLFNDESKELLGIIKPKVIDFYKRKLEWV